MEAETAESQPSDSRRGISPQRRRAGLVAAAIVAVALPLIVWQTWGWWRSDEAVAWEAARRSAPPDRPAGFGSPGGAPGGMGNAQATRRGLTDQIKAALQPTDAEWEKLRPKIEKVTQIQDQLRPRMGRMPPPGAPAGPPPGDASPAAQRQPGAQPQPGGTADFTEKADLLRAAVDDEQTTPQALAANLAAARAAKANLQADLKAAQDDLRKDLTPKQEASLAVLGVLD